MREDSLRSHKKQHRDAQSVMQLQLPSQTETTAHSNSQIDSPYSSAQLKIIVSHPMSQENSLIPAAVESQHKMVLLSPESQDMVVNSMIHQVNLLTPMQPLGVPSETTLEPQTVLLTTNDPLHQALLHTALSAQDPISSQTFITTCSELEGLNALIQEGGTEVTVVTEGIPAMVTTTTPTILVCDPAVKVAESALHCEEGALLVPNVSLGGQNVVIHGVPMIVSAQPQQSTIEQLSSHTLYSDTHTLEGLPQ